ncbi:recombination protein F [Vagococcus lutrae LBD1]|uniref:DNA replication and repair protein RecF n=1 Tax=Vagococcus lutrae LBD1 TaxID=1408226 RepID=V6Q1S5_9ENTE|nr:DNA replication/repair protein RecF [Vagococcus lutrae]EST89171.1 recombination protein F [Vagococcus lutrae LBD1]
MRITQLELLDYRNYASASLTFNKDLIVFLGENAQGKTNVLESLYVLAMTRSHRSQHEKELIRWGQSFARIRGILAKKNYMTELEIVISNKGRRTKRNHIEQAKLSDYIGELNVVLFAPEDLYLIKGSPQNRRKFIDMELGQVNPSYLYHLSVYQNVLKQRNRYLKENGRQQKKIDETYLEVLTEQLAAAGAHVIHERLMFIQKLEQWAQEIHGAITNHREKLTMQYQPSFVLEEAQTVAEIEVLFLEALSRQRSRELMLQTTSLGPHRDDVIFFIDGQNVQTYGSQGQQRTTALSVKLAEVELIHEQIGEYPILLLDDVMSELDDERQVHLLAAIEGKVQTFVTTTTLNHLTNKLLSHPEIYLVKDGQVERKSENA